MRHWPALSLLFATAACGAAGPAVPVATPRPLRVMSLNQCADQLVLALLPPQRIASVTWLSRDPGGSLMAAAARRVPSNRGTAEEVILQRPDLIVTGSFTTPALRGMLKRLGYPMIEVDDASDLPAIRRITRQVAAAVGEQGRGEALIARMEGRFAALARNPAPPLRVAAWDRSGFAAGEGTLFDLVLTAAGADNVVRQRTIFSHRRPDVEELLQADPAALVQGSGGSAAPSLGDDLARHRLVRQHWRGRTLTVPQAYYACGTPLIADAAVMLRRQIRTFAARTSAPSAS